MDEKPDNSDLTESVEELKLKLEAMKKLIENSDMDVNEQRQRRRGACKNSIIDGSFLSFVFVLVLILIICVSIYAFSSLYFALLKKYPSNTHNEL